MDIKNITAEDLGSAYRAATQIESRLAFEHAELYTEWRNSKKLVDFLEGLFDLMENDRQDDES